MQPAIPDILARIVARKQAELADKQAHAADLESRATQPRRDFRAALRAHPPAVIAEIKKASPSKGLLAADFDPARQARDYAEGGASALSVLTDRDFFQGCLHDLQTARAATGVPVLRKDFTIDELDIVEAAAHGADAILLIAAILSRDQMERFRLRAAKYGLAALVEVHARHELDAALESGAEIIGVNNRNLHTFEVRLETSLELAPLIPETRTRVAESGIHGREDLRRLAGAGFHAFLIGEHLMRSGQPAQALRSLLA